MWWGRGYQRAVTRYPYGDSKNCNVQFTLSTFVRQGRFIYISHSMHEVNSVNKLVIKLVRATMHSKAWENMYRLSCDFLNLLLEVAEIQVLM